MPYYEHEDDMNKILALTTAGVKPVEVNEAKKEEPSHEANANSFWSGWGRETIHEGFPLDDEITRLQISESAKAIGHTLSSDLLKQKIKPERLVLKDIHIDGVPADADMIRDLFTKYPINASLNRPSQRYSHPKFLPSGTGPEPVKSSLDVMDKMTENLIELHTMFWTDFQASGPSLEDTYVEKLRQQMMLDVMHIPSSLLSNEAKQNFWGDIAWSDLASFATRGQVFGSVRDTVYDDKHAFFKPMIKAIPNMNVEKWLGLFGLAQQGVVKAKDFTDKQDPRNRTAKDIGLGAVQCKDIISNNRGISPDVGAFQITFKETDKPKSRPLGIPGMCHTPPANWKEPERTQPMAYTGRRSYIDMHVPMQNGGITRFTIAGQWAHDDKGRLMILDLEDGNVYHHTYWESWR